ncbi:uncharacterized protein LOC133777533 [Humulus lupulus]|uniref:uncharacterized protein LOC133777533 n=1 Tax=Humulus lupulus TaxID=3486 RepID=UPI002B401787|nr:uncharacterized protein LOC133777533 [Humulus lupulus]
MLAPGLKPQQEHPFRFHDGIGSRTDQRYDRWERMNYACSSPKPTGNHGDHDSGVISPRLWTTPSPPRSPNHQRAHYRSLSPASRTQAIARGQKELMDMVQNMPESCYELSLRDLVEQPVVAQARHNEESNANLTRNDSQKKRNGDFGNKGKEMRRSGTMENEGLLLKMVFPVSFGSKQKKKKKKKTMMTNRNDQSILVNNSSKVSPKPLVSDGSKAGGSNSGVDKEWWKKRLSVSGESENGDQSSLNSGSMKSSSGSRSSSCSSRSSRSSRHVRGGCWWFIGKKRSKDTE